jgi:hypothetical protein
MGELRPDEDEIDIPGAEGPDVTEFGARQPHRQGSVLPIPRPW